MLEGSRELVADVMNQATTAMTTSNPKRGIDKLTC